MTKNLNILLGLLFLIPPATGLFAQHADKKPRLVLVTADAETTPMPVEGDAADDPAIWIHPEDPAKSTILGTNKKKGINVYSLEGKLLFEYPLGRVNNIDVRYGFPLGTGKVDLVAGSNRSDSGITVMGISPVDGSLFPVLEQPIHTGLDEVYGFCLFHDRKSGSYYAVVNGTDGKVEQWLLYPSENGKVAAKLARTFGFQGQTEGCVADDEQGILYIGEEDRGVWKMNANPGVPENRQLIDSVKGKRLKDDVEGLALYCGKGEEGYLIVSSQGNHTYAVYERRGDNRYVGSFSIRDGKLIDGTRETDGIDVSSVSLSPLFPDGLFVAQDGFNRTGGKKDFQNFKIVSWRKIAEMFDPPLVVDTTLPVRQP